MSWGESVDEAVRIALAATCSRAGGAARLRAGTRDPTLGSRAVVVPDPGPGEPGRRQPCRRREWEITSRAADRLGRGRSYITLEVERDDTQSLRQEGVQRLLLPPATDIGLPANDVRRCRRRRGIGRRGWTIRRRRRAS